MNRLKKEFAVLFVMVVFIAVSCSQQPSEEQQKLAEAQQKLAETQQKIEERVSKLEQTMTELQQGIQEQTRMQGMARLEQRGFEYSPKGFLKSIDRGDLNAVKIFLTTGMDVNTRFTEGEVIGATPLMMAIEEEEMEIIKLLLDHGAEVNIQVAEGEAKGATALMVAAINGDVEAVKLLLDHGADVNTSIAEGEMKGMTALMLAKLLGGEPEVETLLKNAGAQETEIEGVFVPIERSKKSRTIADMRAIGTALGSYQVDYDIFPSALEVTDFGNISGGALPHLYYEGAVVDGWGTPFRYQTDGEGYTLRSFGRDKAEGDSGTSDFDADIVYSNGRFISGVD